MIVVRYADDTVVGFEYKDEAEQFWTELKERMAKFHLELHPEKTRFWSLAPMRRPTGSARGLGKPEAFDFLGFTHICGKTSRGRFTVLRQTIRKRLQAKLQQVKTELRRRMHDPIPTVGAWLKSVVGGHLRYYGVPGNRYALAHFRFTVGNLWHRVLCRRSQKGRVYVGANATAHPPLAASGPHLPSLSRAPSARHYLRQEPDAGNPPVRICAGGGP